MVAHESDVQALLNRWLEAIRSKDIDRLMPVYAPDAVYFDVVPPLQHKGSDAIRRNFLRWFDGWESSIGQEVRELTIRTSSHVAVAHMLIRASGTLKNGRDVGYWVRATVGCQRSNDEWLIAIEHVSLPVELPSGKAAMDLVP